MGLIARGMRDGDIASALSLSQHTVRHVSNIYAKLGCSTRGRSGKGCRTRDALTPRAWPTEAMCGDALEMATPGEVGWPVAVSRWASRSSKARRGERTWLAQPRRSTGRAAQPRPRAILGRARLRLGRGVGGLERVGYPALPAHPRTRHSRERHKGARHGLWGGAILPHRSRPGRSHLGPRCDGDVCSDRSGAHPGGEFVGDIERSPGRTTRSTSSPASTHSSLLPISRVRCVRRGG